MAKKILFKNPIMKQENFPIKIWNVPGGLGQCFGPVFMPILDRFKTPNWTDQNRFEPIEGQGMRIVQP